MGLFSFFGRRSGASGTAARSPATRQKSAPAFDPINPPYSADIDFVSMLYANRARNAELGIAIASKLTAWRLLYQMGAPQGIHQDFRNHLIEAEQETDRLRQVAAYCIMQNVLFANFNHAHELKNL